MGEAEHDIITEYGYTQDEYLRLLKKYKKHKEIRQIREDTKKLVTDAAIGKMHSLEVSLPATMTPETYVKIYRKMLAIKRKAVYVKLRNSIQQDSRLSKESINSDTEKEEVRAKVCNQYGVKINVEQQVPVLNDKYSYVMRRAYYNYMCDKEFEKATENEKVNNNRLMSVILEGWIIPDMEKDVTSISDEMLTEKMTTQIEYIKQFVDPQKSSIPITNISNTRS